jgi:TRAP-type mannitol/chloroaromatic compound transport system permease small subunit
MAGTDKMAGFSPMGPSGIPLPETTISRALDGIVVWIGKTSSWLWTILMLLIIVQVVQRYVIGLGSIQMEEAQWHLFAIGFMLGLSLAEVRERHVRIDVFAEYWSVHTRLWIELIGIAVFLLPLCVFVIWWSIPYVYESWQANEVSAAPGGLPYRYLLKGVITIAFILLTMAGISRLSRVWAALRMRLADWRG